MSSQSQDRDKEELMGLFATREFHKKRVPTTDEEVDKEFQALYSDQRTFKNMSGIYRIHRLEKGVVDAYLQTLQDFLDARS